MSAICTPSQRNSLQSLILTIPVSFSCAQMSPIVSSHMKKTDSSGGVLLDYRMLVS